MRTLHDCSPAEKSAYHVWQSRLADRTLSAAEHDECRREIDNLLWKGPNAQVLALQKALAETNERVARLEFHAGLSASIFPQPGPTGPIQFPPTAGPYAPGAQPLPGEAVATVGPCGQFAMDKAGPTFAAPGQPGAPSPPLDETKVERRGRPKGAKNKPKTPPAGATPPTEGNNAESDPVAHDAAPNVVTTQPLKVTPRPPLLATAPVGLPVGPPAVASGEGFEQPYIPEGAPELEISGLFD